MVNPLKGVCDWIDIGQQWNGWDAQRTKREICTLVSEELFRGGMVLKATTPLESLFP